MMTLTKGQIAENIYERTDLTLQKSVHSLECLIGIIKNTLESGENVLVSGFGKFCVNEKGQRRGRNPATGEKLLLSARKVVTFKYSGKLRDKINS